jgi:carbon monoxide dehydrogenase subunit G
MWLVLVALAVVNAQTTGLTDAELVKVMSGDSIVRSESFQTADGKDAGRGLGAIVVWKPVADVWTMLCRYEDRAEYIPRVTKIRVIDKTPTRVHVWQEIDATVTTARFTAFFDLDEKTHTIHWTLDRNVADNTIKDVDGDYRLFDLADGKTLVVYRTYVDSGLHIAKSIQMYMAKKSIPDLLKAIKARVESGGTWKK